ncbi:TPA: pyridoxine/pyridoxal/pyridoxamine kinase [Burkholderia aenigmatica]|uniref:pyridoxine/pyridoxal/pyridoxamine kinase n=1 Tax=Burkholderia sp. AU45251 TaxID=3059204 RepID=UPI0010F5636B|nr:pyridoxine/pyridoxal/pyridoxamine kinase [Burkholderia sp. AU45251]HDR9487960.1 pyridoxine/pyridoxal/pyridoxamine kinase [Burkholderia aenigmatica]MDN7520991.1 pyridoxine/pyridoxal/pyridoxamine kinase [Burkholderia sp. AU45251]HDR9519677.1 pyridoxine/pyridoxal/pyridoxamine kinase [Burkholderia aenigmatica]HDR9596707.1 pyridoxine/pyridoxal/pyridoxamine kinase [Burkholderia aenigmatica]HDR9604303.1 pyridoxine/pyridoxal/pyridoxamine kinase [Burkholderia aenigmatica]
MTKDSSPSSRPLSVDVVSVQSQVVYGRVGNNAAIPTLEALGLSVAAVPTVVLSNIPHYPTMHGGALPIEWFDGYLQDLSARGALHALRAILVGYLGNPAQAQALANWMQALLPQQAGLRIVIDPVIGDHDHGIYVDPQLADSYRKDLLPLADGLTPNGFELAHLTGMVTNDLKGVVAAARTLLTGRTQWVAVTSAAPETWAAGEMQVALVNRAHAYVITHPRIDAAPKGTGDLFCATLTAHWLKGDCLETAARKACHRVVQAVQHTERAQCAELLLPPMDGSQDNNGRIRIRELTFSRDESKLKPLRTSPCDLPLPT